MLRLYDSPPSGNCYKVRLLLAQLGLPYERVEVDVLARPRPEALLARNPAGRVPVLELEDGKHLPESNAILWFLGDGTRYVPEDSFERAQVLRWLFFEQNSLEPNLAGARFIVAYLKKAEEHAATLEQKRKAGHAALVVVERHLQSRSFLAGDRYTIADIALYAYAHVASEGGIELQAYPAVRTWLRRVEDQPGYVPLSS